MRIFMIIITYIWYTIPINFFLYDQDFFGIFQWIATNNINYSVDVLCIILLLVVFTKIFTPLLYKFSTLIKIFFQKIKKNFLNSIINYIISFTSSFSFKHYFFKQKHEKGQWIFISLFLVYPFKGSSLFFTSFLKLDILSFFNFLKLKMLFLKNFLYNFFSTIRFYKFYLWRPLFKKISYYGLYINSRINFMKFFK